MDGFTKHIGTKFDTRKVLTILENRGLTLNETRKIIGVSYPTMLQLANQPGFPAFRVGKKWIVSSGELSRWLSEKAGGSIDGKHL